MIGHDVLAGREEGVPQHRHALTAWCGQQLQHPVDRVVGVAAPQPPDEHLTARPIGGAHRDTELGADLREHLGGADPLDGRPEFRPFVGVPSPEDRDERVEMRSPAGVVGFPLRVQQRDRAVENARFGTGTAPTSSTASVRSAHSVSNTSCGSAKAPGNQSWTSMSHGQPERTSVTECVMNSCQLRDSARRAQPNSRSAATRSSNRAGSAQTSTSTDTRGARSP
ncbi:aspartyl/glutamyl-tRNA amidotransferase subunit B [Leifsonia xyli subsp. cynodontis DSM 46306]|uniref:Uncharacterized protein n=1 Tax=Leifsonia xyli subsp. cynodontis DSM 46306 TaxID=1389489 RepID=U3PBP7_LEIXC|nr:hypothetical protein [Leifsonia xyli]AGW42162.1 aspartyl/glutamyl-tRNA amidotransferase subunit B [Leifsonia xyli subsp. cynodontis DSM 46306]